jgi:hypothetical protein
VNSDIHLPPSLLQTVFGNRRRIAVVLALFLISRLLIVLTGQFAWDHLPKKPPGELPPHQTTADLFDRLDSGWYRSVARDGYQYERDPATGAATGNLAFYPVFPFFVRVAHLLVSDWLIAAYLAANVIALIACFLLWELGKHELSEAAGGWAVAFALFCPGSASFSFSFSEGSFLLFFLLQILSCRRQNWLIAALAGYFVALTRAVGLLTVIFVALEILSVWLDRNREKIGTKKLSWSCLLALAAPVLGHVSFFVFMQWRFGDWHAQHHIVENLWPDSAHLSLPWSAIARDWAPMEPSKRVLIYGMLVGGLVLSAMSYRALRRWSYPAISLALILICIIATNHSPMARYLSVLVPLHLTLAALAVQRPWLGGVLLSASAGLMCLITALLVNCYWIW